jgi:hypothetical protein
MLNQALFFEESARIGETETDKLSTKGSSASTFLPDERLKHFVPSQQFCGLAA